MKKLVNVVSKIVKQLIAVVILMHANALRPVLAETVAKTLIVAKTYFARIKLFETFE